MQHSEAQFKPGLPTVPCNSYNGADFTAVLRGYRLKQIQQKTMRSSLNVAHKPEHVTKQA